MQARPAERHAGLQPHLVAGAQAEQRGGVAAVDGERQRAARVLVEEQPARGDVRERARDDAADAARARAGRDRLAEPQAALHQVVVAGVEDRVAERVGADDVGDQRLRLLARRRLLERSTSSAGSSGVPAEASGAPPASRAATGAKTSRPWNVAETGSSRHGDAEISTASATPPNRSAAAHQQAVVGADEQAVLLDRAQRDRAPPRADLRVDDREVHARPGM